MWYVTMTRLIDDAEAVIRSLYPAKGDDRSGPAGEVLAAVQALRESVARLGVAREDDVDDAMFVEPETQTLPVVAVGMVVRELHSREEWLISDIMADTDDGSATVIMVSTGGVKRAEEAEDMAYGWKVAAPYDIARTYTGEWVRGPDGAFFAGTEDS